MKLLLDENLPHRLRPLITGHDIFTVAYMKWQGIENGKLLALAASNGFDGVITKDTGIAYEQNIAMLPCSVIILQAKSNSLADIEPLVPNLLLVLTRFAPNSVIRVVA